MNDDKVHYTENAALIRCLIIDKKGNHLFDHHIDPCAQNCSIPAYLFHRMIKRLYRCNETDCNPYCGKMDCKTTAKKVCNKNRNTDTGYRGHTDNPIGSRDYIPNWNKKILQ